MSTKAAFSPPVSTASVEQKQYASPSKAMSWYFEVEEDIKDQQSLPLFGGLSYRVFGVIRAEKWQK